MKVLLSLRRLLLAFVVALSLPAHDFWIEPSVFRPTVGETVSLRFRVGEHFRGDAVPRDPNRIVSFEHYGPDASGPIPGMAGFGPAGLLQLKVPGLHLVGYQSTSSFVQLDAASFELYLREEGLERIIDERKRLGEGGKPGKEFFARCVKSLLKLGEAGPKGGFDRILGFPVELVPERAPYSLTGGSELSVRVLREGKPLRGTLVVAYADADPSQPLRARSDDQGRVDFVLNHAGPWLIKAVQMERIEEGEADWQSWWASLTFEAPE